MSVVELSEETFIPCILCARRWDWALLLQVKSWKWVSFQGWGLRGRSSVHAPVKICNNRASERCFSHCLTGEERAIFIVTWRSALSCLALYCNPCRRRQLFPSPEATVMSSNSDLCTVAFQTIALQAEFLTMISLLGFYFICKYSFLIATRKISAVAKASL